MTDRLQWSALYEARRAAAKRFGTLFRLSVRARIHREAARHLPRGARVLDVGAGDRRTGARLAALVSDLVYESVDVDPAGGHDHPTLAEAPADFDAVLLLEVIEHLPLARGLDLLREIRGHVRPGGLLVVSTPNVAHPWAYLRDATHVTPYAHDELAGALTLAGFETTDLFRLYHASWLGRLLRRGFAAPIHRILGVDYAPGIGALARRPGVL